MEEIRTDINKRSVVFPMTEWQQAYLPAPPPHNSVSGSTLYS